jgi:hypothetical protein
MADALLYVSLLYTQRENMRKTALSLALGMFCTLLFISFIAVLFHDTDPGQSGWAAYFGLCAESVAFVLVIVAPTFVLIWLGLNLLKIRRYPPRPRLGLYLGIGVAAFQYPWEFTGRMLAPQFTDAFLSAYLVGAIIFCPAILLWDSRKQSITMRAPNPTETGFVSAPPQTAENGISKRSS